MVENKRNTAKSIGLIVSGRIAFNTFRNYFPEAKKLHIGSYPVYYFQLNGFEVFLIRSGYKTYQVAEATTLLIEKTNPDLLISFGTGTTVCPQMTTGDVLYANSVTMLENNVFEQYRVISSLREDVRKFVFDIIFGFKARMFVGTLITVNNDEAFLPYEKLHFNHPVYDLETLTVVQIAARYRINALSLRGITHRLTDSQHPETLLNFTWHFDRTKVLKTFLKTPWKLVGLFRYLQNKYLAANHVSSAVYSLLRILSNSNYADENDIEYRI